MDTSTALGQATADLLRAVARFQLAQLGDETYGKTFTSRDLLACSARNLALQVDRLPHDQRPLGWWPLVGDFQRAETLMLRLRSEVSRLGQGGHVGEYHEIVGVKSAIRLVAEAYGLSSPDSSTPENDSRFEDPQVVRYRDALSKIRVRVMQVCDFDSTESACPQDEAFARDMDELNTFVRELTDGMEL